MDVDSSVFYWNQTRRGTSPAVALHFWHREKDKSDQEQPYPWVHKASLHTDSTAQTSKPARLQIAVQETRQTVPLCVCMCGSEEERETVKGRRSRRRGRAKGRVSECCVFQVRGNSAAGSPSFLTTGCNRPIMV